MDKMLFIQVLGILKHRLDTARSPQVKSAYIFAYNLIIYALQGNAEKIAEFVEKENFGK